MQHVINLDILKPINKRCSALFGENILGYTFGGLLPKTS